MTAPQRAVVFAAPVMGRIHEMLTCGHTRTRQPGDVPAQSRRCQDCARAELAPEPDPEEA